MPLWNNLQMMHNTFPQLLLDHPLWEKNREPIWIASHFSLSRNLEAYPFPNKMTPTESEQTREILAQTLLHSTTLKSPIFLAGEKLTNREKAFLSEHFLCPTSHPSRPCKNGFIIDDTASFLATINLDNHLLMQYTECESNWKEGWEKLFNIENHLNRCHNFAYSSQFGYLTASPSSCGTAFLIQTFLHLPCLIHLEGIPMRSDEAFGLSEQLTFPGDLVTIQNRFTLGITEEKVLESVHHTSTSLVNLEKRAREMVRETPPSSIIDKMSRAYGLLLHSFQLEIEETLNALSFLKLGLDLEWAGGITHQKINEISFACRSGHLTISSDEEVPQQKLAHKRAKYLRRELKRVELHLPCA